MQTENKIQLEIKEFIDKDYNPESSFRYNYYLLISQNEMISVVGDVQINKIVSFKIFACKTCNFLEMKYDELKLITEITNEFKPVYKSKRVIICNEICTLVPNSLNNIVEMEKYFQVNHTILPNSQVMNCKLNIFNITSLFNLRNETLKFIRFNLPTADIIHQSLLFIKACEVQHDEINSSKKLYINIHSNYFEILKIEGRQLKFYNNFKYESDTDVIYYILAAAEQLGISADFSLHLYGNIRADDTLYSLLKKYCNRILFGDRLTQFGYPESFYKIPSQFYFHSSSVLLCE